MIREAPESISRDTAQQLRELVEKHTIRYEVYFDLDNVGGHIVQTGFELDLLASHDHGLTRFTPGCDLCKSTFHDLHEIAMWIMPRDQRDSEYVVEPFDRGLYMDAKHKLRPEVRLAIKIEHRGQKGRPLDACEWRCLGDMEDSLQELGVVKSRGPGRA